MKTRIILLVLVSAYFLVFVLFIFDATAQTHNKYDLSDKRSYTPAVYTIGSNSVDTTYNLKQIISAKNDARANATADYHETHRYGYDQVEKPQFIFTAKDNNFSFAVGGIMKLISSYDFGGISNSADFVPSTIVSKNYNARQQFMMDVSTSTVYLKSIANTKALGRVVTYLDIDFRGGDSPSDYKPRLKYAYISFLGLTMGRDAITFCDLSAAPTTIDFAGPNAYSTNFATLIRYEHTFSQDRFRAGVALEMPSVSGVYGDNFEPLPQRIPNVPIYLQYMWDENKSSHLRASAIFRDLYAYNSLDESSTSLLGWGVQLSGNFKCTDWMRFMFNGVYGEGIAPYIQDIAGSGLDFIPNTSNSEKLQTMPMYGMQGAFQFSINSRLSASCGASMVEIEDEGSEEYSYKRGVYAFANAFYKLTPRCTVAGEYLYGSRENMDNVIGYANRLNLMLQYNF